MGTIRLNGLLLASAVLLHAALPATAQEARHINDRPFLDLIGGIEGPDGYNDVVMGGLPPPRPLTEMTIAEVLAHQGDMIDSGEGSAVGRYQFIRKTLKELVEIHDINPEIRFNRVTQDFLARLKMEDCGFYNPDRSSARLGSCLSRTWAALPDPETGKSYYHGKANRALTDVDSLVAALEVRFSAPRPEVDWPEYAESVSYQIAQTGEIRRRAPLRVTIEAPADMSAERFADAVPLAP